MPDIKRNIIIEGSENRSISLDIFISAKRGHPSPLVIYVHGFKGFKDWGHSNLMAEKFAEAGFHFVKFNFSHNGILAGDLSELSDLDAFANNNYTMELFDLDRISDFLFNESEISDFIDRERVCIIGHSRGGGTALIHGAENPRITHIITLAAVSRLDYAWARHFGFEKWKESGVTYVVNSRTGQNLPVRFQLYENFEANRSRLDIAKAGSSHEKPCLIFHGTADTVIDKSAADEIFYHLKNARKVIIPGMDHVFNSSHPWNGADLPVFYRAFLKWADLFLHKA